MGEFRICPHHVRFPPISFGTVSIYLKNNKSSLVISFALLITIFMTHGKITSVFIKECELAKKVLGLSKLNKYGIKLSKKVFQDFYWLLGYACS